MKETLGSCVHAVLDAQVFVLVQRDMFFGVGARLEILQTMYGERRLQWRTPKFPYLQVTGELGGDGEAATQRGITGSSAVNLSSMQSDSGGPAW